MSETVDTAAATESAVKKPKPGTFSSTHQPKHRRTADKIPHNVKADVVAGLAAHGEDGKGKGGFRGYVKFLGGKHPKQAARLIERLLPPSVVVASNPSAQVRTVNIVSIPSGTFLSAEEIGKMQSEPLLLDHEPQPEQIEQLEQLAETCEVSAAPETVKEPLSEAAHGIVPRNSKEAKLLAGLEALSTEELAALAGVPLDDVEPD